MIAADPMTRAPRTDLIDLAMLSDESIEYLLEDAAWLARLQAAEEPLPTLRSGATVATLFFEPSTRTRNAFLQAAHLLSAQTLSVEAESASIRKGESLEDTIATLEALGTDVLVLRHPQAGAAWRAARACVQARVINAGDGTNAHPTQALIDLFALRQRFGEIHGLKVLVLGDLLHSRVARSDLWALHRQGAICLASGPATLLGPLPPWVQQVADPDSVLPEVDAVLLLRLQRERMEEELIPSLREYRARFGMTSERAALLREEAVILHPAPVNRGVEIDDAVMRDPRTLVFRQMQIGVFVRMAALRWVLQGGVTC